MRITSAGTLKPAPSDCKVALGHLQDLGKIHTLLTALNDPYANIGKLVASIPVLGARCVTRAMRSKQEINSIDHALTLIGNKGLESELLTLLEDLTVLKSETDS